MKKLSKFSLQKLCIWIGVGLLAGALITFALWQWKVNTSEQQAQNYVQLLRTLIPEPQNAVPEQRRDNTMSVLSLEGTDFVGIIEMPQYQSALPVGANWGQTAQYPCRFNGSVYDKTLQIGATSQKGQYDFFAEISVGDSVYFTDVEGNRYAFEVTALQYEKHIDQASLHQQQAAMTLFIKNLYAFEYLIVYCNVAS